MSSLSVLAQMIIVASVLCGIPICLLGMLLWYARSCRRRRKMKERPSIMQTTIEVRIRARAQSLPHKAANDD